MTLQRCFATLLLLACLATPAATQAQAIAGRVLDSLTAAPIAAATVMLLDSTDTAVARAETDSVGLFFFQAPGAGLYRVHADRMGYEEILTEHLPLRDAGSLELLVRLAPLPVEVEGLLVETEAEARRLRLEREGFYRRQEWAPGYFFDEEEIQKWRPTFISDLLQRVPGVRLHRQLGEVRVFSARRTGSCPMKIVLDGFKVDTVGGDLDFLVHPDRVIGMEIYPGAGGVGAPVQHRGTDAPCGILMIWTR